MGTFSFAGRWGPEALIDRFGNAQASASVKVYESDGVTLSTLYTDRTKGTTSSNPFAPDARANATFFANPGPHVLKVTVGSSVTTLNIDVPIDPDEATTDTEATAAIAAHAALATGVHGVGVSTVESASGSQAKADAAQAAAIAAAAIDATTKANAAAAASQPLDSDLTAIAALSTTTYGRALLALADAAAGRTALGLGTAALSAATDFQPVDSDLTAIAALTTTVYGRAFLALADAAAGRTALGLGTAAVSAATDFQPVDSDLTAIAALSTTTYGRAFLALADAAAGRTALGLGTAATAASTAFDAAGAAAAAQAASQPLDSDLTAIAALSTTSFGRSFLDRADAAAGRTLLGLGTAATTDSTSYVTVAAGRAVGLPAQASVTIDPTTATALNVTTPDTFPTGLADNSVVEPSILYDPNGTWGYKYIFLACPFTGSDATVENASLWCSNTGQNDWVALPGAPFPLYANGVGGAGYGTNSDGCICKGPDGTVYVFWNQFLPASGWGVRMISSTNGTTWTSPVTVITTVLATSRPTSPSVFYDPFLAKWVMYAVEIAVAGGSPYTLMRYTADAPAGPWTQSTAPTYTHPSSGHSPYHLNAHLIGDQHVLIIADATNNATNGGSIYLAASNDRGASFVAATTALLSGRGGGYWDNALYRADFVPTWRNGKLLLDCWYGGNTGTTWGLAHTLITFNDTPVTGIATPGAVTTDALKVIAACMGQDPYVYGDNMVRADSTSSPGAPNFGGAYTVVAGTWGTLTNRLYIPAAANSKITFDAGISDLVFEAKLAFANTDQLWLIARFLDTNNYIRVGVQGLIIKVQSVVGGVVADLQASPSAGAASGDILKVVFNGTSIKVYRVAVAASPGKPVLVYSVTSSVQQAQTKCGYQANTITGFFRNGSVRSLVNGA